MAKVDGADRTRHGGRYGGAAGGALNWLVRYMDVLQSNSTSRNTNVLRMFCTLFALFWSHSSWTMLPHVRAGTQDAQLINELKAQLSEANELVVQATLNRARDAKRIRELEAQLSEADQTVVRVDEAARCQSEALHAELAGVRSSASVKLQRIKEEMRRERLYVRELEERLAQSKQITLAAREVAREHLSWSLATRRSDRARHEEERRARTRVEAEARFLAVDKRAAEEDEAEITAEACTQSERARGKAMQN